MTTANRRLVALGLIALLGAAPALGQDALPLAERRALKAYQDDVFPGQLAAIRQAAGFELAVEVKWEAVARPGQADRFSREGHFTKVYFVPLTDALKGVASDAMGRDALKARLRQVVITYDKATAPISNYPNGLAFADGVLTINFEPGVNENDVKDRAKAIRDLLESKL
jgi:hypothetical protein